MQAHQADDGGAGGSGQDKVSICLSVECKRTKLIVEECKCTKLIMECKCTKLIMVECKCTKLMMVGLGGAGKTR